LRRGDGARNASHAAVAAVRKEYSASTCGVEASRCCALLEACRTPLRSRFDANVATISWPLGTRTATNRLHRPHLPSGRCDNSWSTRTATNCLRPRRMVTTWMQHTLSSSTKACFLAGPWPAAKAVRPRIGRIAGQGMPAGTTTLSLPIPLRGPLAVQTDRVGPVLKAAPRERWSDDGSLRRPRPRPSCEASIRCICGSPGLSLGDWKSPNTQTSRTSAE
jgi:hypothetical protein